MATFPPVSLVVPTHDLATMRSGIQCYERLLQTVLEGYEAEGDEQKASEVRERQRDLRRIRNNCDIALRPEHIGNIAPWIPRHEDY